MQIHDCGVLRNHVTLSDKKPKHKRKGSSSEDSDSDSVSDGFNRTGRNSGLRKEGHKRKKEKRSKLKESRKKRKRDRDQSSIQKEDMLGCSDRSGDGKHVDAMIGVDGHRHTVHESPPQMQTGGKEVDPVSDPCRDDKLSVGGVICKGRGHMKYQSPTDRAKYHSSAVANPRRVVKSKIVVVDSNNVCST